MYFTLLVIILLNIAVYFALRRQAASGPGMYQSHIYAHLKSFRDIYMRDHPYYSCKSVPRNDLGGGYFRRYTAPMMFPICYHLVDFYFSVQSTKCALSIDR